MEYKKSNILTHRKALQLLGGSAIAAFMPLRLIADPQSAYYINEKKPQALAMSRNFRDKLNKTGAPFDVYSFNDIPEIEMSRYKVIFLPAMFLITPEREKIP